MSAARNEEAARKLMEIRVGDKARARVEELARKCNEGELAPEERAEYETYVVAGELVAILQAQSRLLLSRQGRAS